MSDLKITMVNLRGRVVEIEEDQVSDFRARGWRVIVNPKESYYPQYDTTLQQAKEDELGEQTKIVEENFGNPLGLIVI